jgi:hypothetical protein
MDLIGILFFLQISKMQKLSEVEPRKRLARRTQNPSPDEIFFR